LFNDFASEMVYPVLPAFVLTLGGGAVALGALDGAADLTSAALKWVSGRLSDRPGWRKPLILGGYLSAVLIRPLIAVSNAAWQVIGFRVVDRIGKGLRTPPRDALIADLTPPASRGRAFGFHRAADHFGAVLGSLAAWALLERGTDVHRVIELSLLPGVVAFLVLAVVLRSVRKQEAPPAAKSEATGQVFWAPVLVLAFVVLARMPEALLLLRLQDAGVAVAVIPLVWAGLHVVRTAASYRGCARGTGDGRVRAGPECCRGDPRDAGIRAGRRILGARRARARFAPVAQYIGPRFRRISRCGWSCGTASGVDLRFSDAARRECRGLRGFRGFVDSGYGGVGETGSWEMSAES
jgi:MFS family permease